jgi:hypothetical protein
MSGIGSFTVNDRDEANAGLKTMKRKGQEKELDINLSGEESSPLKKRINIVFFLVI